MRETGQLRLVTPVFVLPQSDIGLSGKDVRGAADHGRSHAGSAEAVIIAGAADCSLYVGAERYARVEILSCQRGVGRGKQ